jgi:hypothetical protein
LHSARDCPEFGGNENAYNYPNDPINAYDLDGRALFIPLLVIGGRAALHLGGRWLAQQAAKQAVRAAANQAARQYRRDLRRGREAHGTLTPRQRQAWGSHSKMRGIARGHEIHNRTAAKLAKYGVKYNKSKAPDFRFYRGRVTVELKRRGRCGSIPNCVGYRFRRAV